MKFFATVPISQQQTFARKSQTQGRESHGARRVWFSTGCISWPTPLRVPLPAGSAALGGRPTPVRFRELQPGTAKVQGPSEGTLGHPTQQSVARPDRDRSLPDWFGLPSSHSEALALPCGRSSGNRITSRIDFAPVRIIVSRSMPMPSPAVGGSPYPSART